MRPLYLLIEALIPFEMEPFTYCFVCVTEDLDGLY